MTRHEQLPRQYARAAAYRVVTIDEAARRKLRRRTIRRFENTRASLIERGATNLHTLTQKRGMHRGMLARFRAHGVPEADWQHLQRCRPGRAR